MAKNNRISVGRQVTIPAGTRVTRAGITQTRQTPSIVTVRAMETTRAGNPKIYWKSNGLRASAVLK
jgi:hypothetical protein